MNSIFYCILLCAGSSGISFPNKITASNIAKGERHGKKSLLFPAVPEPHPIFWKQIYAKIGFIRKKKQKKSDKQNVDLTFSASERQVHPDDFFMPPTVFKQTACSGRMMAMRPGQAGLRSGGPSADGLDDAGRHASHDDVGWHVAGDHGTGADDGPVADADAGQDRGVRAHPDVPAQTDGRRHGVAALAARQRVVERGKNDAVAYLAAIAQIDAAMVLKLAAGVDEDVLAHMDVFPEIGIERRKDAQRGGHGAAEELGEQRPHLVHGVVGRVEPEGDAPRLVGHLVHQAVYGGRVERTARFHIFEKGGQLHAGLAGGALARRTL